MADYTIQGADPRTSSRRSTWEKFLQHFDTKPESVGESVPHGTRLPYDI